MDGKICRNNYELSDIYIYIYPSSCFHMFFVCCQEPCSSIGTSWFFHMMHALFIIPNSKLSGKYNFPACYIQKKMSSQFPCFPLNIMLYLIYAVQAMNPKYPPSNRLLFIFFFQVSIICSTYTFPLLVFRHSNSAKMLWCGLL